MKTLQTGTKVLIEATVLQIDSSPNALLPYLIKLNTGDQYWTALKDLTVCETAEEKPALWKVHKSDPDFEKVYNAIKNGFDEEGRRAKYDDLIFIGKGPLPVTWTEEDRYIQAYPTITGQQALKLLGVSKPIDLQNFCIDITDSVNAELLPGFKEWYNSHREAYAKCHLDPKSKSSIIFFGVGKDSDLQTQYIYWEKDELKPPVCTLPELQKQHPDVFEKEPINTDKLLSNLDTALKNETKESFEKWYDNQKYDTDPQQIEVGDVVSEVKQKLIHYFSNKTDFNFPMIGVNSVMKIVEPYLTEPVPTPSFKAGQEVPKHGDKIMVGPKTGTYCCPDPVVKDWHIVVMDEESKFLSLALGDIRPIPAQPTVESELRKIITEAFESGNNHGLGFEVNKQEVISNLTEKLQKHSGRVEVSVPSDEEIMSYFHKFNDNIYPSLFATVRHFMTRKEQQG